MKREDIIHLADLSRIKLSEEEIEPITKDITSILGYVSDINDIAATEPAKEVGPVHNVMREDDDMHEPGLYTDAILEAAPERIGQYVKVKKILGGGDNN